MPFTLQQNATSAAQDVNIGTTLTATLGSTPAVGDLLVAAIFTRSDTAPTNPSGWSTAITVTNATEVDYLVIAYKVAVVSEPTAVVFTGFAAGAERALGIFDWFSFNGFAAAPLDKTASTGRTASATSLSSGTTATILQPDELCIAAWGIRDGVTATSVDSSFTQQHSFIDIHSTTNAYLIDAYRAVTATGAYATTASWTTARTAMGAIATFKSATAPAYRPMSDGMMPIMAMKHDLAVIPMSRRGRRLRRQWQDEMRLESIHVDR